MSPSGSHAPTLWTAVDDYLADLLLGADPVLDAALADSSAAGLPSIAVSPNYGKFLRLLAELVGARAILEIGTLGGYSTIWLARALPPGGTLITLELDPDHAEVARRNIERAGYDDLVDIRVGPAADTLRRLVQDHSGPFDVIFLDADKAGYPDYLTAAVELSRPGTLIIADNVVRDGAIIDESSEDPDILGIREFLRRCGEEPRLSTVGLQTVGTKGYDGLALVRVLE